MSEPIQLTNDRWYPRFHVTAPSGWINDPNGLCFFNGRYHAFFQHHPYSSTWGPMHWGHASSSDLATWQEEPIALAPGEPGDDDADGIWSGSAVVHEGILYAFYTGNRWVNGVDDSDGKYQTQMLATSSDGIHFAKHGAVVPPIAADARDPKVFWVKDRWYMTIGANINDRGHVLLYSSRDLHNWSEEGSLFEDPDSTVFMIECPDFFPIGDKWVLLYGPMVNKPVRSGYALRNGHNAGYVVGTWSPGEKFMPETSYRPLDWGHHFYATQSMAAPDGRRIAFGWMGEFANPLATQADGWSGQLSVPRVLSLSSDLVLLSTPVEELKNLFSSPTSYSHTLGANERFEVSSIPSSRISLKVDLNKDVPLQVPTCEQVVLRFTRGSSSATKLVLDTLARRVHLVYGDSNGAGRGYRSAPWTPSEDITFYLDKGSIEIFIGEGRETLSSLDFEGEGSRHLSVHTVNGPASVVVDVAPLT